MKKKIIIKMLFILAIAATGSAKVIPASGQDVLPLQEFIRKTCEYDITFRKILSDNLKLKYLKDQSLQSSDIILAVTGQYNIFLQEPGDSGMSGTASLSKLFPDTGTEASVSYTTRPAMGMQSSRTSAFTAQVSQPIAQNAFGYLNRLAEDFIDIEIDVAEHQVVEAYEDYLASVIVLYYDWYTSYSNLKTAQASLEENKKILNNIKAKKRFNIANQSDVDKITLQIIEKQENVYSLENAYEKSLSLILQASGMNDRNIVPEFSSYSEKDIDFDGEYAGFFESGRTVKILDLLNEKGSVNVKAKAGALLPSLDIIFGYSRDGNEYLLSEPEDTLYLGFSFQLPFQRSKAKAAHEISKIEKDSTALNAENTKRKLETNLKSVYNQIRLEEKLIQSSDEKIGIGERILKSEAVNYQQARIGLSDLIKAINDLESLKYSKSYHLAKLNTLKIEWLRLTDKLVFGSEVLKDKKQ